MLKFKSVYSLFFLIVLLICISKNSFLFALYKLDTSAFVTLFCENTARPELNCNGHCALAQMSKEQDQKEGASALVHLQEEVFFYYQDSSKIIYKYILNTSKSIKYPIYINKKYTQPYLTKSDKPPEILS